ncbi:hypothetical protein LJ737_22390 [Hymenobacter sp. 15J16-1T3B]|uniref:hypothetical protein n=1 Tax=Hymenobacter sp. 15J16-1T3B TaxID=2886941 RepID=UPI001D11A171|nr:hypothetical protein [Hymenobacter sp. 15J16-1T3B]MCC3160003.1 hypothetical protein [Hymenobacter sp. 15J16-1T3B]
MRDSILHLKPWQVFLVLLAPYFASWYVTDEVVSTALCALGALLLVSWLVLVSHTLLQLGRALPGYAPVWVRTNALIVAAVVIYSFVASNPSFLITATSVHADGLWALLMSYVLFAYLHLHWFPASLLVAKEQRQRPDVSQVLGAFLLLIFWPIGVWVIQDRINVLAKKLASLPADNVR